MRPESKEVVSELGGMGIRTVLLTGDNSRAADHMAAEAGISEVVSGCTPEGKLAHIESLQSGGSKVCMIGDGVNDAPSLRKAWVGMAMGGIGSDIAVESADMVLVGDRVDSVPHVVALCRKMKTKINANIAFSLCWNFLAVGLAMFAVLGPVEGAIVHNVGSVAVVVNSALLLVMGRRKSRGNGSPSDA
jgi:P-type E1-E2 ATPase